MKKFLLAAALIALLSSCNLFPDIRAKLRGQIETSTTNAIETAKNARDQIEKTKESVQKKVEDVRSAVKEVKQAADEVNQAIEAVQKVTGGNGTTSNK